MKLSSLKTSGFAATRARLGLSQRQMAEQLGISKAAIGMTETGRRNLPVTALLRLAELEIKMASADVPGKVETAVPAPSPVPIRATCIQIRELHCDIKAQKLAARLEAMTAKSKRLDTQIQLLDGMLQAESSEPGNMFWMQLQVHRDHLRKQLEKCCATEQAMLRNRIALLRAEAHMNKSVRIQM